MGSSHICQLSANTYETSYTDEFIWNIEQLQSTLNEEMC